MTLADYDLIVIGGGPAGLTAGMYAARARLKVLLIERLAPGGQVLITDWVENFPGFPEGVSGPELIQKMTEQAERFGLVIENEEVLSLEISPGIKTVQLSRQSLTTRAVIIATGAKSRKLGVNGEEAFYGRGVSFCATCDAPFFRDQVLAAVGGGDTAVQESLYLTKFARKVYLIHRRDRLRATKILQERAFENERLEIIWDSVVTGIQGQNGVEGILVKNVKTGQVSNLEVNGCFIWIGISPNTAFLDDVVKRDPAGFILVDQHMQTSVPGVFAVGDARSTPLRQIITAAGDAAIAAVSAEHYIENLEP